MTNGSLVGRTGLSFSLSRVSFWSLVPTTISSNQKGKGRFDHVSSEEKIKLTAISCNFSACRKMFYIFDLLCTVVQSKRTRALPDGSVVNSHWLMKERSVNLNWVTRLFENGGYIRSQWILHNARFIFFVWGSSYVCKRRRTWMDLIFLVSIRTPSPRHKGKSPCSFKELLQSHRSIYSQEHWCHL